MSDQNPPSYGMFFPSQNQESDGKWQTGNYDMPLVTIRDDPLSVWGPPPPNFSAISLQEAYNQTAALYSHILNDLSSAIVEAPASSLPFQQQSSNPGHENRITGSRVHEAAPARYSNNYMLSSVDLSTTNTSPLLLQETNELIPFPGENILLHGCSTDNRQSSSAGTKRKQTASDYLDMQKEESEEDGAKEESKQLKRTHDYAQVHNLNNRLRRRKFKEKLKVLQELVPKCNKRDKEATLDDAIEYIKILQNQVQEKQTTGSASFPVPVFPWMMQPPQPGMQVPTLPQFLRIFPGMGMGMAYPMGLSNPWASGLPNPGNAMEPWIGSQFATQGETTSPTESGHNKPS
ncbi:hypothetical protein ABFS82_05G128200 [Erythranthe guttata]